MKWLTRLIDRAADSFGSLGFIIIYNIVTLTWVMLGIFAPWFPDKYPSNFYTMLVSWLAIDMSSFILYIDRRRQAKERADEEHQRNTLNTLLALAESQTDLIPLLKQVATNQVTILEMFKEELNVKEDVYELHN